MNIFAKILSRLTGKQVEEPKVGVLFAGRGYPGTDPRAGVRDDDVETLARWTGESIFGEVEFGEPGSRLNIITTGDLDKEKSEKQEA